MDHPFSWLPPSYRWAVLGVLVVGSVAFAVVLGAQGRPLINDAAPAGIVTYELAWTKERAGQIINSWAGLIPTARWQLLIDFGFIVFYPLAISLGCEMLAGSRVNTMPAIGFFLSWAVLVAGPLDATENLALLHMLQHGPSDTFARLAGSSAGLKFVLVYAGLGYLVLQGLTLLIRKLI